MFYSVKELIQSAKESRREAWELILMDDANERNVSQKESFEKMRYMWHSMKNPLKAMTLIWFLPPVYLAKTAVKWKNIFQTV